MSGIRKNRCVCVREEQAKSSVLAPAVHVVPVQSRPTCVERERERERENPSGSKVK